jgi:hypothetical protein
MSPHTPMRRWRGATRSCSASDRQNVARAVRNALRAIARFFKRAFAALLFPLTLTRQMSQLSEQMSRLAEQIGILAAASVESVSYVGVELRRITSLLEDELTESGASVAEVPFAFRSLASVDPPARILISGVGNSALDRSLEAIGYEVTYLGEGAQELSGGKRFDAILSGSGGARVDSLAGFAESLKEDGLLVLAVPFSAKPRRGSAVVHDRASLSALLQGWRVTARTVVARRAGGWAPIEEVEVADGALALVAARPPKQKR